LLEIEGFDEEIVEELRSRAKNALLISAIAAEESIESAVQPDASLLTMDGMDSELARAMANQGIVTMDDLAEQAVDDLLKFTGVDEDRAAKLIMKAREPWFVESTDA
jgi:N utilization substance protein A